MSSNEPDQAERAQRLDRIGITEDEVCALERIWNTETFRLIVDQKCGSLADNGYTPLDSLDAIWHELDASHAHLYMQHGFTPHQAYLLDNDRNAQRNLWGPEVETARVHRLLSAPLNSDLLVRILLAAETPDQAEAVIDSWTDQPTDRSGRRTSTATTTQANLLAALQAMPALDCECDF